MEKNEKQLEVYMIDAYQFVDEIATYVFRITNIENYTYTYLELSDDDYYLLQQNKLKKCITNSGETLIPIVKKETLLPIEIEPYEVIGFWKEEN